MPAITIPTESGQRITARLGRVAADLFRILDEVREHGGTYIEVLVERPGGGEKLRLLLVEEHVTVDKGD